MSKFHLINELTTCWRQFIASDRSSRSSAIYFIQSLQLVNDQILGKSHEDFVNATVEILRKEEKINIVIGTMRAVNVFLHIPDSKPCLFDTLKVYSNCISKYFNIYQD